MALNNQQYQKIMDEYEKVRLMNSDIHEKRTNEIYEKLPEYKELCLAVYSLAKRKVFEALNADEATSSSTNSSDYNLSISEISDRKRLLLTKAGYPADYLDPIYQCKDCYDTGYISYPDNTKEKCHCLRKKEFGILYDQSNIRNLIANENFQTLSYAYYSGDDLIHFEKTVDISKNFVQKFEQDYQNLFFYGTVGTGKSFLSGCIANEILNTGHSVIYFSASSLFENLAFLAFSNDHKEDLNSFYEDIYNCDLLIIDDLGTEVTNSFVSSRLFACLNERHLRHKATIISSNLNLEDLRNRYSDRVFSRITSNYSLCKLSGPDIRMYKKRAANSSY